MNITISEDCGNAPKKAFLRDFNIAFAENNIAQLLDSVTDDFTWELIGNTTYHGKEAFGKVLAGMLDSKATELVIRDILTHGDIGAIHGSMSFDDGSTVAFCDICTFNSHAKDAKIKAMTSYGIELKK